MQLKHTRRKINIRVFLQSSDLISCPIDVYLSSMNPTLGCQRDVFSWKKNSVIAALPVCLVLCLHSHSLTRSLSLSVYTCLSLPHLGSSSPSAMLQQIFWVGNGTEPGPGILKCQGAKLRLGSCVFTEIYTISAPLIRYTNPQNWIAGGRSEWDFSKHGQPLLDWQP